MTPALVGALAVPAAVGGALLLAGSRLDRAAGPVGVAVGAVELVLALLARGGGAAQPFLPGGPFAIAVDGLAAVVLVLVAAVATAVLAFAAVQRQGARFTGLMLVFVAAVDLTVTATTLPALLAGWEVMGAASALLIALHVADPEAVGGGLTAFLTTRTADLGLVLAVGAAAAGGGGFALADLPAASPGWRDAIAAGVVVAALGKAAQPPFSFWLSRAMAGPSAVSALLHSAAMVAMGGYLLLRVRPLLAAVPWAGATVAVVGAAAAVLLGVVAVAQTDLKQLLAASTGAQLGFVLVAAGTGAVAGGAAQLLAHAVVKAALFLVAGAWLTTWGRRGIAELAGAGRRDRTTGVVASVAAAALAGLPPLSIWAAKDLALADAGPALTAVALVAALLSAVYAGRIVRLVWRTADDADEDRVPLGLVVPAAVLAAAGVALGAVALPAVETGLGAAVGVPPAAPSLPLALGSGALAIGGLALGALREPPRLALAQRWFGLEAAAHAIVVRPVLRLAAVAARVDGALERTLAGAGPGPVPAAAGLASVARGAARLDDAGPGALLVGLGAAAAASGRAARRLQTGRLQDYYLLAAAAGAVLVVLAVAVR